MILEEVLLPGFFISSGKKTIEIDYIKVLELSDDNFRQFYLELMTELWKKENWNNNGNSHLCNFCDKKIQKPEDIIRYFKLNFHKGKCFVKARKEEKKPYCYDKFDKYFDRIVKLII